jgi:hypothetical protein
MERGCQFDYCQILALLDGYFVILAACARFAARSTVTACYRLDASWRTLTTSLATRR